MKLKFIFFLLMVHGAVNADVAVIQASVLKESYSENVEVSGEYIVGVQLASKNRSKSLHVLFKNEIEGVVCISLSSIDGKYKAKIQYPVLEPVNGLTKINFKSSYREIMNKYTNEEIAILASIRKSCESADFSKRLVASWGDTDTDVSDLVLLIRSDARKDVAYMPNKKNKVIKSKCKKIRKSNNISYDKSCVLKRVNANSALEIEIVRKNLQPIESERIRLN